MFKFTINTHWKNIGRNYVWKLAMKFLCGNSLEVISKGIIWVSCPCSNMEDRVSIMNPLFIMSAIKVALSLCSNVWLPLNEWIVNEGNSLIFPFHHMGESQSGSIQAFMNHELRRECMQCLWQTIKRKTLLCWHLTHFFMACRGKCIHVKWAAHTMENPGKPFDTQFVEHTWGKGYCGGMYCICLCNKQS